MPRESLRDLNDSFRRRASTPESLEGGQATPVSGLVRLMSESGQEYAFSVPLNRVWNVAVTRIVRNILSSLFIGSLFSGARPPLIGAGGGGAGRGHFTARRYYLALCRSRDPAADLHGRTARGNPWVALGARELRGCPIHFNGRIDRRREGRDRQQRQRDWDGKGGAAGDGVHFRLPSVWSPRNLANAHCTQ